MADSFNKKDREKRKRKRKQEKAERKKQRQQEGKTEEFMYVDENGNLTSTPPDPTKKTEIKAEDIEIGVPKYEELGEEELIRKGTVKFFNVEKGYGFIIDAQTKESHFVHIDNISGELNSGDKVTFEASMGPKGPIALNVQLV